MMHALVRDGAIVKRQDFSGDPPALAPNKGVWLPVVSEDRPSFDLDTEACVSTETISESAVTQGWAVRSLTSAELSERRADIAREAERRIAIGKTINGVQFRTDDATMIRLKGLIDAFDAGLVPAEGVTYRTASGVPVTYTSKSTVASLYAAANLYRSAVLEASNTLQTNPPADYTDDSHWP